MNIKVRFHRIGEILLYQAHCLSQEHINTNVMYMFFVYSIKVHDNISYKTTGFCFRIVLDHVTRTELPFFSKRKLNK